MLDLLHASAAIRLEDVKSNDAEDGNTYEEGMKQFHERRLTAFEVFDELGIYEGQADIYFQWAIAMAINACTRYEQIT